MITNEFKEAYKSLNKEQKEAVDTIEGPVMVVAGPGTGKTQILTLRIANILLKTQVNPENILAVTFTESAKSEMRQRLVDIIGTAGYKVEINTFHGFCNEIIKNHPENFPYLISSISITDVEQIQIMEKIISDLDLKYIKPFGDQLYYLKPSISEINNLKKEGVTTDDLETALQKWQEDFDAREDLYHEKGKYGPKVRDDGVVTKGEMKAQYRDLQKDILKTGELLILYQQYQKMLVEQRKYDFNDMLLEVKNALQNDKDLRLRLQEKFQYFLVDEHQDTNAAQNKIIELLGSFFDNPNIFVVGDEKQAIFRFQGASLENFLYFKKIYPKAKLIHLKENYRSHQKILDAADCLISNNISANLLSKNKINLISQKKDHGEPIKSAVFNDYFAEYQFIAEDVEKKLKQRIPPSEIAVIARNNKDLNLAAETMERLGLPYFISSDQNIFQDLYIQKLIIILRAIGNVGSEKDLLSAMHIDLFNIEPLDIYKIVDYARKERKSIYDVFNKLKKSQSKKIGLSNFQNLSQFYQNLVKWQKLISNSTFEQLFITVVEESGLREALLRHPKRYELLDKLTALFEEIKSLVETNPSFGLMDFLNYLDLCQKHELPLKSHVQTVNKNAIRLTTAHRSKGLEFDCVYIINAYDGHWGNSRKRSALFVIPWEVLGIKFNFLGAENEDERRLFYVAMTRARKDIIITYSSRTIEGTEKIPTQFLSEIDSSLIKMIDTEKFESEFLMNKDKIFNPKISVEIPAKNKEYLKHLFSEKGLSATGLDNYLKCPWQFFYRNLLQFPEVKQNHLIFGTAFHYAIASYIRAKNSKLLTKNFLIEKFNESLLKQAISDQDLKVLLEKGQKALLGYFENVIPTWSKDVQSEIVIKGVKLADGVVINGRLDMIEMMGNGENVTVRDFKTGRVKSRKQIDGSDEKSDYRYFQQLVFYKILLDRYKNGLMKMREGIIDFVEPDKNGKFKSERFEVSEQDVKQLEEKIIKVTNEIMNLEFWDKRCDDHKCEYCRLRNLTMEG